MNSDQDSADRLTVRLRSPGILARALDFSALDRKKAAKPPASLNPRDLAGMSGKDRSRTVRLAQQRERQNSPKVGYTTDPPYPKMRPATARKLAERKAEQHVSHRPPRSKLVSPPGIRETQKLTQDATMKQRVERMNVNTARIRYGLGPLSSMTHTTAQRNRDLDLKNLVPRDQYHALNFVRRLGAFSYYD